MHASPQRRTALLLFVVSVGFYLLTLQRQIFGDGIFFEGMLPAGEVWYYHVLYLPACQLVWHGLSFAGISPETALKVLAAVAGGAGVALTYYVANLALTSGRRAMAAALLLMVLPAWWFHSTATELHSLHAACSLILFLSLLQTLHDPENQSRTTLFLVGLGACLTPASHASGIAMGLPILYVLWMLPRRARMRTLMALLLGFAVFTAAYAQMLNADELSRGHASRHTGYLWAMLASPGTILPLFRDMAGEFLMYALPASALAPAGLRILFRTAPRHAWLCLLWVLAWPIAVLPVRDFAIGSYHMPTFPILAILAVVAFHGVAQTPRRALVAFLLAALPSASLFLELPGLGLLLFAACATLLVLMTGELVGQPRWLWLLPAGTLLVSGSYLAPLLFEDPVRTKIHKVEELAGDQDLVLFLAKDTTEHHHWVRFFPGTEPKGRRAFNPSLVDHLPEADRHLGPGILTALREVVRTAMREGRTLWMVGDIDSHKNGSKDLQLFFAFLRQECRFEHPDNAPEHVYRLSPRH